MARKPRSTLYDDRNAKTFIVGEHVEVKVSLAAGAGYEPMWMPAIYLASTSTERRGRHAVTLDGDGSAGSRRRDVASQGIRRPEAWTCYAIPASTGRECGVTNHFGGVEFKNIECCVSCGSTRVASIHRQIKKESKKT